MVELPNPPLRRRRILERPRLIRALDCSSARVRMLVAGAGYGKTTLAEQWAAQQGKVAWVRARRSSADVAVLARQMAAASAELLPGSDRRLCERLKVKPDPADALDVLVDLLSADLADWPEDAWVVVDDYHHAKESVIAEAFIEGVLQKSRMQVLLTSRERPTWVSTRSVLYGEVLEVGQTMLAMSEDEVDDLLAGAHEGMSSGLLALAGGWPAVVSLASLTTSEAPLPEEGLDIPERLYEFFAEEVYRSLDRESRHRSRSACDRSSSGLETRCRTSGRRVFEPRLCGGIERRRARGARCPTRVPPTRRSLPRAAGAAGDLRRHRADCSEMSVCVPQAHGVGRRIRLGGQVRDDL